jgi:hypothetical protein
MTEDLRSFYVYAFLRSADSSVGAKYSPYYVGKGKDARAYSWHRSGASRPTDSNFIVFVQEGLTEKEAFDLEKYCITLYGRVDLGTGILRNLTDGGEGKSGFVVSEDVRRKISEAQQGEKHYFFGQNHHEDTKKKISEAMRGEKHPLWGKTHSQESKRKMSRSKQGENNNRFGTQHSQETKLKIKLAKVKYLYEFIDKDGEVYIADCLSDFCKQYGLSVGQLSQVVNGKVQHHKRWTGRIVERLR